MWPLSLSLSSSSRHSASMFRYCFHQQCEGLFETSRSRDAPLIVSQAYHHELIRGNDQCSLTARAGHVVRLLWNGKCALPVYPKEAAVNGTVVGIPCRRQRAHELHETVGQNALAVPNAVLKIKVSQASPVASRHEVVALREKISKRIGFDHHRPDADLVEQCPRRKRQILLAPFLDSQTNQVIDQHWVGIVIPADTRRRPLQRPSCSVMEPVDTFGIQIHMFRIL